MASRIHGNTFAMRNAGIDGTLGGDLKIRFGRQSNNCRGYAIVSCLYGESGPRIQQIPMITISTSISFEQIESGHCRFSLVRGMWVHKRRKGDNSISSTTTIVPVGDDASN